MFKSSGVKVLGFKGSGFRGVGHLVRELGAAVASGREAREGLREARRDLRCAARRATTSGTTRTLCIYNSTSFPAVER